ncbi:SufE family protein [Psychromonas algicola]|uniref:SufE family protein n=1 Tax=Psychromonas algicola TaxID=2555642 RepID=UPI001067B3C0|nr:SufE family protein [Psychromonas sp. RZ5]TEW52439.1 SufE family protein [Psychromonas sp. RZ5]
MVKLTATTINDQQQLLTAFAENKSWDAQYRLIIQLGKTLAPLQDEFKIETNQVKGCESLAWLVITEQSGIYHFNMDSDTRVVKGLMKIITLIFEGKTKQQIDETNCEMLFEQLGLLNHLSPSRANGLFAIINRIQSL